MHESRVSSASKTILIVEDHPIFLGALKQLIHHQYPLVLVHTVDTCDAAERWLAGWLPGRGPDLILCDLGLPDARGLDAVQRIVHVSASPVMVVSAAQDEEVRHKVLALGAKEFVSKRSDSEALLSGLSQFLGPVEQVSGSVDQQAVPTMALSASQARVARLLIQGHPNKEIARKLELGPETVKSHVREIMAKVGARNRTEAVLKLLQASP